MAPLNLLGAFADPNGLELMGCKLVNVRPVLRSQGENKPALVRLVGSPGLQQLCRPDTTEVMALGKALATTWAVYASGNVYYDVHTASPKLAGSVGAPGAVVRVAEDITGLCIATATAQAFVATTTGITNYTATGFIAPSQEQGGSGASAGNLAPTTVGELDNMTIWGGFSGPGAQPLEMFRSVPLSPGTVDALWFASKEARADPLKDVCVIDLVMWVIGNDSLEMWFDAADGTNFPFDRFPNSLKEVGILARPTLARCQSAGWFVGTDRRVWSIAGQTASQISPPWVDLLLQGTDATTLTSYAYAVGGDTFYVLTSVGAWTIEVATSTGIWTFRQSPGRADHAGRCGLQWGEGGQVLVGLDTGEICAPSLTLETEPTGKLKRDIITGPIGAQETKHTVDQIDITSSMGPSAGDFDLTWSDDKGATWRGKRSITWPNPGHQRAVGRGFGASFRRQFRIEYSGAQAPFSLDEFWLRKTEGT